jgi:hypothetical protein
MTIQDQSKNALLKARGKLERTIATIFNDEQLGVDGKPGRGELNVDPNREKVKGSSETFGSELS